MIMSMRESLAHGRLNKLIGLAWCLLPFLYVECSGAYEG